jgi:hypothetical protein
MSVLPGIVTCLDGEVFIRPESHGAHIFLIVQGNITNRLHMGRELILRSKRSNMTRSKLPSNV